MLQTAPTPWSPICYLTANLPNLIRGRAGSGKSFRVNLSGSKLQSKKKRKGKDKLESASSHKLVLVQKGKGKGKGKGKKGKRGGRGAGAGVQEDRYVPGSEEPPQTPWTMPSCRCVRAISAGSCGNVRL